MRLRWAKEAVPVQGPPGHPSSRRGVLPGGLLQRVVAGPHRLLESQGTRDLGRAVSCHFMCEEARNLLTWNPGPVDGPDTPLDFLQLGGQAGTVQFTPIALSCSAAQSVFMVDNALGTSVSGPLPEGIEERPGHAWPCVCLNI